MATAETRKRPNILITGTPGTGKTTLGEQIAEKLGFDFLDVGKMIRENKLIGEYDDALASFVLDEDKLLDHIADRMDSDNGGAIVDYHGCDFFPERWFDIVVVLRCSNDLLYNRLAQRGYNDFKIKNNIECEIFGSLVEEAKDAYKSEIIHELKSETPEEMEANLETICQLAGEFKKAE